MLNARLGAFECVRPPSSHNGNPSPWVRVEPRQAPRGKRPRDCRCAVSALQGWFREDDSRPHAKARHKHKHVASSPPRPDATPAFRVPPRSCRCAISAQGGAGANQSHARERVCYARSVTLGGRSRPPRGRAARGEAPSFPCSISVLPLPLQAILFSFPPLCCHRPTLPTTPLVPPTPPLLPLDPDRPTAELPASPRAQAPGDPRIPPIRDSRAAAIVEALGYRFASRRHFMEERTTQDYSRPLECGYLKTATME